MDSHTLHITLKAVGKKMSLELNWCCEVRCVTAVRKL